MGGYNNIVINSNTSLQLYVRDYRHDMDGYNAHICDNSPDCTYHIFVSQGHN